MMEKNIEKPVGNIPSGLFIVCVKHKITAGQQDKKSENKIDGYLASWVQQVSFKPLRVTLAIKPGRPAYDNIMNGEIFSINIVGEHDKSYLKHFWSGYSPDKNPFAEIPFEETESGAIVLKQAKSVIVCKKVERYNPGDHELVVADVLDGYTLNENPKSYVHLRKSGLDY